MSESSSMQSFSKKSSKSSEPSNSVSDESAPEAFPPITNIQPSSSIDVKSIPKSDYYSFTENDDIPYLRSSIHQYINSLREILQDQKRENFSILDDVSNAQKQILREIESNIILHIRIITSIAKLHENEQLLRPKMVEDIKKIEQFFKSEIRSYKSKLEDSKPIQWQISKILVEVKKASDENKRLKKKLESQFRGPIKDSIISANARLEKAKKDYQDLQEKIHQQNSINPEEVLADLQERLKQCQEQTEKKLQEIADIEAKYYNIVTENEKMMAMITTTVQYNCNNQVEDNYPNDQPPNKEINIVSEDVSNEKKETKPKKKKVKKIIKKVIKKKINSVSKKKENLDHSDSQNTGQIPETVPSNSSTNESQHEDNQKSSNQSDNGHQDEFEEQKEEKVPPSLHSDSFPIFNFTKRNSSTSNLSLLGSFSTSCERIPLVQSMNTILVPKEQLEESSGVEPFVFPKLQYKSPPVENSDDNLEDNDFMLEDYEIEENTPQISLGLDLVNSFKNLQKSD